MMKMSQSRKLWSVMIVVTLSLCLQGAGRAAGQSASYLTPAESSAKAKAVIERAITAMGGDAYLKAHDVTCDGRLAVFTSQGLLSGYDRVYDQVLFPDKNRTEYNKKRNVITINNGERGWSLDRGGVEEIPAEAGQRFVEGLNTDIHHLFRFRMNEEGMIFRYGGMEMVDLKPADWVEVTDRDRRVIKIAFAQSTGLPVRAQFVTRDRETRVRTEQTDYYSNYQSVSGVQTALRIWRERNGRMYYQVFWDSCAYNTGLAESHFTREALDVVWAKLKK